MILKSHDFNYLNFNGLVLFLKGAGFPPSLFYVLIYLTLPKLIKTDLFIYFLSSQQMQLKSDFFFICSTLVET